MSKKRERWINLALIIIPIIVLGMHFLIDQLAMRYCPIENTSLSWLLWICPTTVIDYSITYIERAWHLVLIVEILVIIGFVVNILGRKRRRK